MAIVSPELHAYPYMSNSDAHSTGKIAREYNVLALHAPTFGEWEKAMLGRSGCHVVMNCGIGYTGAGKVSSHVLPTMRQAGAFVR